ncbi:MAG: adenylate kinase [Planctomycetota bacterium]
MGLRLVFLGPPGVGKGTQAVRLAAHRGIPHISTGDILRAEVSRGTDLGRQARGYMDAGELVPDDLVVAMVARRLEQDDCRAGYLLDGFPRTMGQATAFEEQMGDGGAGVDQVLYFTAPDAVLIERLGGRRLCPNCQAVYHVQTMPPKDDNVCDRCGTELIQREDDRPEAIKQRLAVYRAETEELIEHYRRAGLLVEIDGSGPVDQVAGAVRRAVDE